MLPGEPEDGFYAGPPIQRWMDKREQLMANVVESINIAPISSDYLNA